MEISSPDAAPSRPPARRLLLVEDDAATARALATILIRRGLDVRCVATIADADLELARPTDYMILDLMLPDGDGATLLGRVRAAGLPIKVVVTTGSSDSLRLDAVSKLGPDAMLGKPIDLKALLIFLDIAPR